MHPGYRHQFSVLWKWSIQPLSWGSTFWNGGIWNLNKGSIYSLSFLIPPTPTFCFLTAFFTVLGFFFGGGAFGPKGHGISVSGFVFSTLVIVSAQNFCSALIVGTYLCSGEENTSFPSRRSRLEHLEVGCEHFCEPIVSLVSQSDLLLSKEWQSCSLL